MNAHSSVLRPLRHGLFALAATSLALAGRADSPAGLAATFVNPPDADRPWVYWYFMDGNLTREGMTADLEAMKRVGIGGGIFLEVNVGVPRGPVGFMSDAWRGLFRHAAAEAERLGLQLALGAGPGWCGTGGPWVAPEQSMQHLVAAEITVRGPARFDGVLPRPPPRAPFFGEKTLTPELREQWLAFYRDVAVLAFPTPEGAARVADLDEKALYHRAPYSSQPGVKPHLPPPAGLPALPAGQCIPRDSVVDLTPRLSADGRLAWDVPPGSWTIVRFGRTSTGQCTRPAPQPGLGFECDKFSRPALDAHFAAFGETLLKAVGARRDPAAGITTLHFDSWEMSSQNWSEGFRDEFLRRRGYDLLRFLPVMAGRVVDSLEISERFLWDLRQTAQELVIENHAMRLKELGRRHGLALSIEPYDLNPCADLALGAPADVPQCEFWAKGHGFKTAFSVIEASSIAHTMGRPVVAAESFTSAPGEDWRLHPGAMKAQTDWALCAGINRIIFHTFQHQPWLDRWPGMAMGPYGVHWQRTQTWWEMAGAYHRYIARCQHLLRQGAPVADILYLAAEGAPHVFRPPPSALAGDDVMPDRRGYNFDGVDPAILAARAEVRDGRIVLRRPPGEEGCDSPAYRVLVLPDCGAMTPGLLGKVKALVEAGATVVGPRPAQSPSLSGHPACDAEVRRLADALWGAAPAAAAPAERRVGRGLLIPTLPAARASAAEAPPGRLPGREAQWIWTAEGDAARSAPRGTRHFRRAFYLADTARVGSAWLTVTADNSYEARVNGRKVGTGDSFHFAGSFDVTSRLRGGTNWLTVAAVNGGDTDNPAGLIATLEIAMSDGPARAIHTGADWETSPGPDGPWTPARALGALGMAPWGAVKPAQSAVEFPSHYADYETVAGILAARGVPPDFEADRPLRYIHRRTETADLYFVSNPDDEAVEAGCRFRPAGRHAALWDPLTGRIAAHAATQEKDGRMAAALTLEPHGSAFVVFADQPDPAAAKGGILHPKLCPVLTFAGPWDVSFQPGRGAPASARFPELAPWNEHADEGIRHFSGTAVYRKRFQAPAAGGPGSRAFLDLGRVEVMARVTLNGRDLGVVWTPPFRVDVASELRKGDNELEIEVANLWPNRLIGDQGLPEGQRITWTTWNPYKKEDPLLPSGLLGPVRLMAAE